MPTRTIRLPYENLIGGVSQQPDSNRAENQCTRQDDADASVVDGLGKRNPLEHVATLDVTWLMGDYDQPFVHFIDLSPTERYMIVVNDFLGDGITAFDLTTGLEVPVTGKNNGSIDSRSLDYLDASPSSRSELAATTIGDRTYLLNKTKRPAIDTTKTTDALDVGPLAEDLRSRSSRRWFIFLRSSNYLERFAVRFHDRLDARGTVAPWSPPRRADPEYNVAWVKTFDGDPTTYVTVSTPYAAEGHGKSSSGRYSPAYDPANLFSQGKQLGTLDLDQLATQLVLVKAEPNDNPNFGTALTRFAGGIYSNYFWQQSVRVGVPNINDTLDAYRFLRTADASPASKSENSKLPQVGSVVKLELEAVKTDQRNNQQRMYRDALSIEAVGQGTGVKNMIVFADEVSTITDLPLQCEHDHVVKISGDTDDAEDDYYVRFVVNEQGFEPDPYPADNLGSGYWEETCASLSNPKLDEFTMPHVLQRVEDGGGGYRFEFYAEEWEEKNAGDDESNPPPSFVGKTIQDVFLFRNRLGFISDSRVIMSEADNFANFWRTTVQQLLDSDPIDIDAGHRRVANLENAIAIENQLFLFGEKTQFLLDGNPILTPRTATTAPVTEYESLRGLRPIVSERSIYFGYQSSSRAFSRIRSLSQNVNNDSFSAFDVTGQVPRYIPGDLVEMTATSLESVLCARTAEDDSRNIIYVYRWFDRNEQRLQSSWMRYRLGATGLNTQVLGMQFFDDDLYLLMRRHGDYSIEKLNFSGQRGVDVALGVSGVPTGDDMAFKILLDRRVDSWGLPIVYDSVNSVTKITLPYKVQGDANFAVVLRADSSAIGLPGDQIEFTLDNTGATTIVKLEDSSGSFFGVLSNGVAHVVMGQVYEMVYEFSRPSLRQESRTRSLVEVRTGRLQLYRGHISFEDTGYAEILIAPGRNKDGSSTVNKPSYTYRFPMLQLGVAKTRTGSVNIRDDVVRFPIRSLPEDVTIEVRSDAPYPCNPKQIEYEATYSSRGGVGR